MHYWFCLVFGTFTVLTAFGQAGRKNHKPEITGQHEISTDEEIPVTIQLSDLEVRDRDDWWYPWGFTLHIYKGDHYAVDDHTIIPDTDFNGTLSVPVTVNDGKDESDVYPLKVTVNPVNDAPLITGQEALTAGQGQPIEIQLSFLTVSDPDNDYPAEFTLHVSEASGNHYTATGNTVTPSSSFTGMLTVPVRVNDGTAYSAAFALQIKVNPANKPPVITGQIPLAISEDETFTIQFSHLKVVDPDDHYPEGFRLTVLPGTYYTIENTTVKPAPDYAGNLSVNVIVNDGTSESDPYAMTIAVLPVNDPPVITAFETDAIAYSAGAEPVSVTETLEVEDVDDDSLAFAEIGFSDNYFPGSDELTFEATPAITGSMDRQTGVLTLSGEAPVIAYIKAIRSVQYNFIPGPGPSFDSKTLYLAVNDGEQYSEKVERRIGKDKINVVLDIPAAFTPNGDAANDTWIIKPLINSDEVPEVILRVYNKKGQLLFESTGLEKSWDGKFNGELLPADTYYYTIDLHHEYSRALFKGIVAILR